MNDFLNSTSWLWKKKEPKEPETPKPEPQKPTNVSWLRVGLILRAIPFQKLGPVFFTVPIVLFFAISGLIAWVMVMLRFAISVFKLWT